MAEHQEQHAENCVVHNHNFNLEGAAKEIRLGSRTFLKMLVPPMLLAGAVIASIKTDGENEQVNWLIPAFTALCFWTYI